MAIKKLIATTVSSREMRQRRKDEGKTTSSNMFTTTQGIQGNDRHTSEGGVRQELKQVDGDFSACVRRENKNNENKARRNEDLKWKGGGRLKLCNVDGDVPLCLRRFDEENEDSSSSSSKKKKQRRTVSGSGSKDLCCNTTEKKNQESEKNKE